jgi:hypothetical protein
MVYVVYVLPSSIFCFTDCWVCLDSMLYHPAVPDERFRYPENMPAGYRNPKENGMEYTDVSIVTKDKLKLHAWFIKANPNP